MASAKPGRVRQWLILWGPVVAYMALLFCMSSRPGPPAVPGLDEIGRSDKIKHFMAYCVLGAMIWRALSDCSLRWWRLVAAVAMAAAYGLTDELHQMWVPGRSFERPDLLADALGAALAAITLTLWKGGSDIGKEA